MPVETQARTTTPFAVAITMPASPTATPPNITTPTITTSTITTPAITAPTIKALAITTPVIATPAIATPTITPLLYDHVRRHGCDTGTEEDPNDTKVEKVIDGKSRHLQTDLLPHIHILIFFFIWCFCLHFTMPSRAAVTVVREGGRRARLYIEFDKND